jgi:hypothetical protein
MLELIDATNRENKISVPPDLRNAQFVLYVPLLV